MFLNQPVIINNYLKTQTHRNPLKYIERFSLNTYFNIFLPEGKKAYCYRTADTVVNLGFEKTKNDNNLTAEDILEALGGFEVK